MPPEKRPFQLPSIETTGSTAKQICDLFELPKIPCFTYEAKRTSGDLVTLDELDEAFLLKANRNGGIAFLALHESGSIDFCRPTSFQTGFRGNTREAYMRLRAHANGEIVLSRIPWNNKEKRFAHVESILPVEDPKGLGQWLNFFAANIWQASRNIYGKPLPKPRAPYLG